MKIFSGNCVYRGASYDFKMCAKSIKEVAERLNVSVHHVKMYFGSSQKIEKGKEFSDIMVVPYGTKAILALGCTRETMHDSMTIEEFKRRVDEKRNKEQELYNKDSHSI